MSVFVRFEHVKKVYQMGEVQIEALRDATFTVGKGELCVICGEISRPGCRWGPRDRGRCLRDATFTVGKGELCVIVGPSGAGKTTLLNILGGMDTLTQGRIFLVRVFRQGPGDGHPLLLPAGELGGEVGQAVPPIAGLGVGFFSGLRTSQPAMMATGIDYLEEQRLYDFRLLSTPGVDDALVRRFRHPSGGEAEEVYVLRDGVGPDHPLRALFPL